jgi:hypothetical protein
MRLNIDVTESRKRSLEELQARTGASSMKELINNALSLLQWAVDEVANGHEIAAVNEDEPAYRVLVTPLLQHVAKEERKEAVPV